MALEWVVLGYAAAVEAVLLLLLTMPGLEPLRKGLIVVARSALKPMLTVVPFSAFLLMDLCWKYEMRPVCEGPTCSPTEQLRHHKSIMKSQRNGLLIAASLVMYWLLYRITTKNLGTSLHRLDLDCGVKRFVAAGIQESGMNSMYCQGGCCPCVCVPLIEPNACRLPPLHSNRGLNS
eukprot:Gb_01843 [translate_table: standard]